MGKRIKSFMWLWWDSDHDSGVQTLVCWLQTPQPGKVGIWVNEALTASQKPLCCQRVTLSVLTQCHCKTGEFSTWKGCHADRVQKVKQLLQRLKYTTNTISFPLHPTPTPHQLCASLALCWLEGTRTQSPNSHYLLFKLNREAAFAIFTKIQWPSTNICHSRISSSHSTPGTLTQHSQPPAGTGTLPFPVNLQTLHLPPAQAVTPSQWQTGKDLPLHLACFLADYKKGSQQRHFSSFAEFCTTLQLPIKLWRLLWLTLALLFLLPVLGIAKGLCKTLPP